MNVCQLFDSLSWKHNLMLEKELKMRRTPIGKFPVKIEGRELEGVDINLAEGTVELIPSSKIKIKVTVTGVQKIDFDLSKSNVSVNDALSIVQCEMLDRGLRVFLDDPLTSYGIEVEQAE